MLALKAICRNPQAPFPRGLLGLAMTLLVLIFSQCLYHLVVRTIKISTAIQHRMQRCRTKRLTTSNPMNFRLDLSTTALSHHCHPIIIGHQWQAQWHHHRLLVSMLRSNPLVSKPLQHLQSLNQRRICHHYTRHKDPMQASPLQHLMIPHCHHTRIPHPLDTGRSHNQFWDDHLVFPLVRYPDRHWNMQLRTFKLIWPHSMNGWSHSNPCQRTHVVLLFRYLHEVVRLVIEDMGEALQIIVQTMNGI